MWQIGVDVLPKYCRKGIAAALTSRLAIEILERGKVPFYCCAWSNLKSARNAIKSGFRPAWIELTVKPASFVEEMIGFDAVFVSGEVDICIYLLILQDTRF